MKIALVALLAAALEPGAPATPAASAVPLREITHVRATTPLCRDLAESAGGAIELETRFDTRLTDAENVLATVDLDANAIAKNRGASDLRARFVELERNVAAARTMMKAFAQRLKDAPDERSRADLERFADALDGALHHQQSLADDLGRFLAYVDTHDPIDASAHDALQNAAIADANTARRRSQFDVTAFGPTAGVPQPLSAIAKTAAAALVERAAPLANDERQAADRIDPAFGGC